MKKFIILFFIISLITGKNTFSQFSQLTVFHEEGLHFWLILNGVRQNETPLHTVYVDSIRENYVKIKIIFEDEKIADLNKNVQLKNIVLGKTHTVMVIKQKNADKAVMRFYSNSRNIKTKK